MKCQECGEVIKDWVISSKEEAIEIASNMILGFNLTKEDLEFAL